MHWVLRALVLVWGVANGVLVLRAKGTWERVGLWSMTMFFTVIVVAQLVTSDRVRRFAKRFVKPS